MSTPIASVADAWQDFRRMMCTAGQDEHAVKAMRPIFYTCMHYTLTILGNTAVTAYNRGAMDKFATAIRLLQSEASAVAIVERSRLASQRSAGAGNKGGALKGDEQ